MPELSDILFHPPARAVPGLLRDLVDVDCSLADIAAANHTSVQALTAWMLRPDIRRQLEEINAVTCWRTRLVATTHLHASVAALNQLLTTYLTEPDLDSALSATPASSDTPAASSNRFSKPTSFQIQLLRIRRTDSIRRCIALAVNLTRLPSIPYLPPQPISKLSTSTDASPPTGVTSDSPPIATGATGGLPPVTSDRSPPPQTEARVQARAYAHIIQNFAAIQAHTLTRQPAPQSHAPSTQNRQPGVPPSIIPTAPLTPPPTPDLTPVEHLLSPVPQVAEHWP